MGQEDQEKLLVHERDPAISIAIIKAHNAQVLAKNYSKSNATGPENDTDAYNPLGRFSSSFNLAELIILLSKLRDHMGGYIDKKQFNDSSYSHEGPIVLIISSIKHTIMVAFHPLTKTWYINETNIKKTIDDTNDLAEVASTIMWSLSTNENIVVTIEFHVSSQDRDSANDYFSSFINDKLICPLTSIHNKENINRKDSHGFSLLHVLLFNEEIEKVSLVLNNGADTTVTLRDGSTLLSLAIKYSSSEMVEALLSNEQNPVNPNIVDHNGFTPLYHAVKSGYLKKTKLLLTYNADPNITTFLNGNTLLHIAVSSSQSPITKKHMVLLLLRNKAEPNQVNDNGEIPSQLTKDTKLKEILTKQTVEKKSDESKAFVKEHPYPFKKTNSPNSPKSKGIFGNSRSPKGSSRFIFGSHKSPTGSTRVIFDKPRSPRGGGIVGNPNASTSPKIGIIRPSPLNATTRNTFIDKKQGEEGSKISAREKARRLLNKTNDSPKSPSKQT